MGAQPNVKYPPRAIVIFTPFNLNFGNFPVSTASSPQTMSVENIGNLACTINVSSSDPRFVITPSGNINLEALGGSVTLSVVFTSTATLGPVSATFFSFAGQAPPSSGAPALQANVVAADVPLWTLTPSLMDFGTQKVGTSSASQTATITNTSNVDEPITLTITADNFLSLGDFSLSGLPPLPFSLTAGESQTFQVTCNAAFQGPQDYSPGLNIVASEGPYQSIELKYSGFLITPAYPVSGNATGVLFGFSGLGLSSSGSRLAASLTTVVQSLVSLPPEADATFTKLHDFGTPSETTYTNRFFIRTEPLGVVTATLASTSQISDTVTTNSSTVTRDATNDSTGIPTPMIFDMETNGEIHSLLFTVPANSGILSILNYIPTYETRGSVYESNSPTRST